MRCGCREGLLDQRFRDVLGERLAAGSLKNCMVPPSPARNSAVTPLGFVVMRYAGLVSGWDTEKRTVSRREAGIDLHGRARWRPAAVRRAHVAHGWFLDHRRDTDERPRHHGDGGEPRQHQPDVRGAARWGGLVGIGRNRVSGKESRGRGHGSSGSGFLTHRARVPPRLA